GIGRLYPEAAAGHGRLVSTSADCGKRGHYPGKSTILEALEIFFNDGKPERGDACVHGKSTTIRIGCAFTSLPTEMVLDSAAHTSLAAEHLLNENGELEIIKEWNCSGKTPKEAVFAAALHPTNTDTADLLTLKNSDLKARIKKLGIPESTVNLSTNGSMRQAIRSACEGNAPVFHSRQK
uniref:ATP-binding protein n=1 Tax=Burkholderia sp. BCC0801 TaxID=2676291 RepID=UPI001FC8BC18